MKKTIILASNNEHKIKEFCQMFSEYEILSLKDINFNNDIIEDGKTFLDNALIKAKTISKFLQEKGIIASVLADDSGLCVNCLNGEPGVMSARYSGEHGNDIENRKKLLDKLKNKEDRSAYFICVLVELFPDGNYIYSEGKTFGYILEDEIGDKSFGYDCLFYSNELKKSFGEATNEEKNNVSHR